MSQLSVQAITLVPPTYAACEKLTGAVLEAMTHD